MLRWTAPAARPRARGSIVRRKIVGLAVGVSLLTVALFGVPLAVAVWQYAVADERNDLQRAAGAVATAVAADVGRNDPVDDPEWTDDVAFGVYDHHGTLIAGVGPDRSSSAVTAALQGRPVHEADAGDPVVTVPVSHDAHVIGAVRAAAPHLAMIQRVTLAWGVM